MFVHPLPNLANQVQANKYTVMSQEGTWKMGDSTATVLYTKEDRGGGHQGHTQGEGERGDFQVCLLLSFFRMIIWDFVFHLDFHAMVHNMAKCFENALFT